MIIVGQRNVCKSDAQRSEHWRSGGKRTGKFRFGRNVANAFLSVAKLQKKPMQKALAAYEDGTFNLP